MLKITIIVNLSLLQHVHVLWQQYNDNNVDIINTKWLRHDKDYGQVHTCTGWLKNDSKWNTSDQNIIIKLLSENNKNNHAI